MGKVPAYNMSNIASDKKMYAHGMLASFDGHSFDVWRAIKKKTSKKGETITCAMYSQVMTHLMRLNAGISNVPRDKHLVPTVDGSIC